MRWDIFCTVIDNFGDIAITWRLSADLASRGEQVRLWIDDPAALAWLAPGGCPGVEVRPWTQALDTTLLSALPASEVWIEAFGCDIPAEFIAACAPGIEASGINGVIGIRPVWLNLEYLSAEAYVERSHTLPSPVRQAPVSGGMKWFFYPGFTRRTGGLLREADLLRRQAAFDATSWLAALQARLRPEPLAAPTPAGAVQRISLFCYEPAALPELLRQLDQAAHPTHLLVTSGRATAAIQSVLQGGVSLHGRLSISYVPTLTQRDYDHLLWACDLNFVRGEDSIVRALWAGKPFVWQIYPQQDGAHHAKLDAFLSLLQVPASLREAHLAWNESTPAARLPSLAENIAEWRLAAEHVRSELLAQDDLVTQLLQFVLEKR